MRQVMLTDMEHGQIVHLLQERKRQALRIVNHHDPKVVKTPERRAQRAVAEQLQELIDKLQSAEAKEG